MTQLKEILTSAQCECIQKQTINHDEPGSLLRDFSSFIDFIGTTGISVSKKNNLVAMKDLQALNQRMSKPLDIYLKRPQQKSFPHINGLYLLLRASGLTRIVCDRREAKLMLNDKLLAEWQALNPTECYFTLFYAWWHRGNTEIIGERGGDFWGGKSFFYDSLYFFSKTLNKQLNIKNKQHEFSSLRYLPGLHNLALMELFGFITIKQDAALSKENWPITEIKPTLWGTSVLTYFSNYLTIQLDTGVIAVWGEELKTYRPDWQKNLEPSQCSIKEDGGVILKVALGNVSRTLSVPNNINLDELAECILSAFNFDKDHLYEFIYKNSYGITEHVIHSDIDIDDECLFTDGCIVGQLPLYEGSELTFRFDLGDNWEFLLRVESFINTSLCPSEPTVIEQHGNPPEQYPDWG